MRAYKHLCTFTKLNNMANYSKFNCPMSPHVCPLDGWLVGWFAGWLVGRLVCLSIIPKRAGSYNSMLLSEHFFLSIFIVLAANWFVGGGAGRWAGRAAATTWRSKQTAGLIDKPLCRLWSNMCSDEQGSKNFLGILWLTDQLTDGPSNQQTNKSPIDQPSNGH